MSHTGNKLLNKDYIATNNPLLVLTPINHPPWIITHNIVFLKWSWTSLMVLTHQDGSSRWNIIFPSMATNDTMELRMRVFYLHPNWWQLWEWHTKSYGCNIAWSIYVKAIHARFKRDTHYLRRLTKLFHTRLFIEFISSFEKLHIRTKNLTYPWGN